MTISPLSSSSPRSALLLKLNTDHSIVMQTPTHPLYGSIRRECLLHRHEMASSTTTERSSEESRIEGRQLFSCTRKKRYGSIPPIPYYCPFILISPVHEVHCTDELLMGGGAWLHRWRYLMHESRTTFHKHKAETREIAVDGI